MTFAHASAAALAAISLTFSPALARPEQAAPPTERGEVREDKALVYLIRRPALMAKRRTAFVYADKEFLGTVDSDSYSFAYVDPGHHLVWTNWTSISNEFDFVAGKTYVLEVFPNLLELDTSAGMAILDTLHEFKTTSASERATAAGQVVNRYERAARKGAAGAAETQSEEAAFVEDAAPPPGSVHVPAGTSVKLELMENVTSAFSEAGETIWFRVVDDVALDGRTLVRKGTRVSGLVRRVLPAKPGGTPGSLDIAVATLIAADGTPVPVAARVMAGGRERTEATVVATAALGVWGLLVKGRQAFAIAGDFYEAHTTVPAWFLPPDEPVPSPSDGAEAPPSAVVLNGQGPLFVFDPEKGSIEDFVRIRIASDRELRDVVIERAGDIVLATPVKAKSIKKEGASYLCLFPSWSVVRYLRTGTAEGTSYHLAGKRAGDEAFVAEVTLTGRLAR